MQSSSKDIYNNYNTSKINKSAIIHLGNLEKHSFLLGAVNQEIIYGDGIWAALSRSGGFRPCGNRRQRTFLGT